MSDQPKRPRGRPPGATGPYLPPDQRKGRMLRAMVTDAQAAKWERLGGAAWLRGALDRAR